MVKGLFTAWTGMANEQKRLDIVSNNLANASTVGFKKDNVTNQSFDNLLTLKIKDSSEAYHDRAIGSMSLGVKVGEVYTDHNQGSLRNTGSTYDLAIEGSGFFNVSTTDANGDEVIKYTRNGNFTMNQDGVIMDLNGNALIGEGGRLTVPLDAADIVIDQDGSVYANGNYIDKVKLTDFEDYDYLVKQGDNMYIPFEGAQEKISVASINQGFTEQSNVNVIKEMTDIIAITRAYEANQKIIQTIDGTLDLAANTVGKV